MTWAPASARDSRFVIVGAGGLGGPVACALAAAGAGQLTLVDPDVVELSNLHRQIHFRTTDIGTAKVTALAGELIRRGYPPQRITTHEGRFDPASADALLADAQVAVECTDDPPSKFLLNDRAAARKIRFAIGGVERWHGQILSVWPGATACYRCLFEDPPTAEEAPSCAQMGVVGAAVAVIAGHLAAAALELAETPEPPSRGHLTVVADVTGRQLTRQVRYNPRNDCSGCPN